MLKKFWKSRTIKVSTLIAMLGALEATSSHLQAILPQGWFGYFMIGMALVMAYLRTITVDAIKDKAVNPLNLLPGNVPGNLLALFQAHRAVAIVIAIGGICLAGVFSALHYKNLQEKARESDRLHAQIVQRDRQEKASTKVAKREVQAQERVRTIFVEREKEIEENADAADTANDSCRVLSRTVRLWNSANQLQAAGAAAVADVSPSGVELTDIERQHEIESRICHQWIERAKGLEQFYLEQRKALSDD